MHNHTVTKHGIATMSTTVTSLIESIYKQGGRFIYDRVNDGFYLSFQEEIPESSLADVERNKKGILAAIGGKTSSLSSDSGDNELKDLSLVLTKPDGSLESEMRELSLMLSSESEEVTPADEVNLESMNRHYHHFTTKFNRLATTLMKL